MEFIKSGWKTVVGAPTDGDDDSNQQQNVAETVEKLVERVETSTLLEDRRDACRAIRSLSKTYRLEVGAQAMDALMFVLQNDSSDSEIVTYALDSLLNVIGNEDGPEGAPLSPGSLDLCVQFTEIFIKRKENVQLVLDLLPEFDFKIRFPSIKLLHALLKNKLRECQDCILTHPMGISRMMDLLLDPREVIRNDALLLLVFLTKSNANIQKIVAFENAFDRILEIVSNEGYSDGGVVVEDCLSILLNLLKMNTSNQNYFKEGNYIQRLLPFFDIPFDVTWNPQKISNILLMFKVIRGLVSPSNPLQVTNSCQKVMNQSGVLQKLCTILLSNGIPAEILTETINCVAEVIRGNQQNQEYFSRVNAPIEPPRPVIVILLMSMINEKQPFELRCAVLYCFQSFLYKNELGQAQIVETLLPSTSDAILDVSAGQLLCSGFFSNDILSNWFVAVALSHTLVHNVTQKEQLLRVQLATDGNNPPTSLLAFCSSQLQKGGHHQRRISLLMLLAMWLSNSAVAVSNFLSIPTNIPYLTSQVGLVEGDDVEVLLQGLCAFLLGICICYNDNSVPSFTKDDLCKLIQNRIGVDVFTEKLASIAKNEKYSHALQKPYLDHFVKNNDIIFDFEFCNLFKLQEANILKVVHPSSDSGHGGPESNLTSEDHKLLVQYKELIREQDIQLVSMRKHLVSLQTENDSMKAQLVERQSVEQQLRDQIALLKVQKSVGQQQQQYEQYQQQQANNYQQQPSSQYGDSASTMPSPYPNHPQQSTVLPASVDQGVPVVDPASNSNEHLLRQHIDQLSYELNVRDQNLQHLTHQLNSMRLGEPSGSLAGVGNQSVNGETQSVASVDAAQYDYLINENRRLLGIIDQYKYWESTYAAAYANATAAAAAANNNTNNNSTSAQEVAGTVNGGGLPNGIDGQFPEQHPACAGGQTQTAGVQCAAETVNSGEEVTRLRSELENIRKEHDDLTSVLADQNMKMQQYEQQLKDDSAQRVNHEEESTAIQSLESLQLSSQQTVAAAVDPAQSICLPSTSHLTHSYPESYLQQLHQHYQQQQQQQSTLLSTLNSDGSTTATVAFDGQTAYLQQPSAPLQTALDP